MQPITEKHTRTDANAWGRPVTIEAQQFCVAESDVGTKRAHYLGHDYAYYTFTKADVGRLIEVQSDGTGWTCWYFNQ